MSFQFFAKRRAFFLFLFCLIFTVSQIQAAVSVDSRSNGGAFSTTGVTSLTLSHPLIAGSGTNRALYVTVSATSAFPCSTISLGCTPILPLPLPMGGIRIQSAAYNSVAMTKLLEITGAETSIAVFRLVDANLPATGGSYSVVVNTTPGISTNVEGNGISFTGVSQTTPNGAFFSTNGTTNTPEVIVTDSVAGDVILDILGSSPNAVFFTAGMNQIVCTDISIEATCTRGRGNFSNAYDVGSSSTKAGNIGSVPMSWTMTFPAGWIQSATAVKQFVATAAGASISGRVTIPSGKGLARTRVTLTDSNGETRTALTNIFGFYRFEDVPAGETYIFNVVSPAYTFSPQSITVNEDTNDLNFVVEQ